jgi:hypothetical protein
MFTCKSQTQPDLRLGTEFRWKTFIVTIDFTVAEFVRHERLAWDAHCDGAHAYHAWALGQKLILRDMSSSSGIHRRCHPAQRGSHIAALTPSPP